MYPKAMCETYNGLPILRLATNNFVGALLAKGQRHNFVFEWLSWCEATQEAGVSNITSEFKGGESYVLIERAQYGDRIDVIWNETIGVFLEEEERRTEVDRQQSVADINQRLDSDSSQSSEDEEEKSDCGRSSRLSMVLEGLEEYLQECDEEEEENAQMLEEAAPIPDLDTSLESGEENEESPPPHPYAEGLADLNLMRRAAGARNIRERPSVEREAPFEPRQPKDRRPADARFRFSKKRETLRSHLISDYFL